MAKKETQAGTESAWTPRSQASILREQELEGKRRILQATVARLNEQIAEAELHKKNAAGRMDIVVVKGWVTRAMELEAEVEVWEDQLAAVEKEIEGLQPTEASIARRRQAQDALASAAEERLALDAQIDAQLAQLRDLLGQRGEVSARMAIQATELELSLDLDVSRFDALLASLPGPMAAHSRSWAGNLLGRPEKPVRCIARGRIVIGETLTGAGVHSTGDELLLDRRDFETLHRADNRPAPHRKATWAESTSWIPPLDWRCEPQSVLTPQEYQLMQRQAEEEGCTVEDIIAREDQAADEANYKRFQARAQSLVRVKVLRGEIESNGRLRRAGEATEIPYGTARELAERGQVQILSQSVLVQR
jgi:hypothetical protein